ncbi:MAG: hypothetical protein V7693_15910 [Halopseudomonas sabulinigri]
MGDTGVFDESEVVSRMRSLLVSGDLSSGQIYHAIKSEFTGISPLQIECCAHVLVTETDSTKPLGFK